MTHRSGVACPVCESGETVRILTASDLPIFCNIQVDTVQDAQSQPTGDIHLEYCLGCSHVFNSAFDESLLAYSEAYENSLHFSATFRKFADELAAHLVEKFSLHGKKILDIGCGKGDFLALICELGANDGYGFDKSYEEGRAKIPSKGSVQYFQDFYSSDYSDLEPDLISCRHVLEHIPQPRSFLDGILAGVNADAGCKVYFEVPNVLYTIRDMGIWDIIYEHCQYFSAHSLAHVFAQVGVQVESVYESFGRQFVALEGSFPVTQANSISQPLQPSREAINAIASSFEGNFDATIDRWQNILNEVETSAVVWGAGSKGTTFLNLLQGTERVAGIVDINPKKQGKFVPGTGHEILAPEALLQLRPEHVFIMNPIYRDEIESSVRALGADAQIHVVE